MKSNDTIILLAIFVCIISFWIYYNNKNKNNKPAVSLLEMVYNS